MSYVLALPDALAAAAVDVADIGRSLGAVSVAAAAPTTGMLAAAGDEVSAAIAALFRTHGDAYQSLSLQASAFHEQFVKLLAQAGTRYASAEQQTPHPWR